MNSLSAVEWIDLDERVDSRWIYNPACLPWSILFSSLSDLTRRKTHLILSLREDSPRVITFFLINFDRKIRFMREYNTRSRI